MFYICWYIMTWRNFHAKVKVGLGLWLLQIFSQKAGLNNKCHERKMWATFADFFLKMLIDWVSLPWYLIVTYLTQTIRAPNLSPCGSMNWSVCYYCLVISNFMIGHKTARNAQWALKVNVTQHAPQRNTLASPNTKKMKIVFLQEMGNLLFPVVAFIHVQ